MTIYAKKSALFGRICNNADKPGKADGNLTVFDINATKNMMDYLCSLYIL